MNTPALTAQLEQAAALHQQGQIGAALQAYRALLALAPNYFEVLYLLGVALHQNGQPMQALPCFEHAISLAPTKVMPHYSLGNALRALGQAQQALQSYEQAIALKPDFVDALYSRGNALRDLKQNQQAVQSYDQALALSPEHKQAWVNRANALYELKRPTEALASCERALALDDQLLEAWLGKGNALQELQRPDEALACYEHALALKPDYVQALSNRGNVLRAMNQPQQALDSYQQALLLQPNNAGAHWNESLCHLLLGDLQTGWRKYEWRWQTPISQPHQRSFAQPLWLGQTPLQGKTILLHAEQGFGDTLQFCRYAALVAQCGAKIVLEVPSVLVSLMQQLPVEQVIPRGQALPAFDYHCPLMSLPLAFHTDLTNIPPNQLSAPVDAVKHWKKHLGSNRKKLPRIGLSWAGNPLHPNDHNRSIELTHLLPLLSDQAQFFALQKELRPGDEALLAMHPEIAALGTKLSDFAATAAAIELLDLVITVDAAVAHLAGALGKQVWVLLPYAPDWRWLLERADSPWYLSARLFRQPSTGDWASVVQELSHALAEQFASAEPWPKPAAKKRLRKSK